MYLLDYTDNCADEFDVYGFKIVSEEYMAELIRVSQLDDFEHIHYIGTNESVTIYQSGIKTMCNDAVRLTPDEVGFMENTFALDDGEYGAFPSMLDEEFSEEYWGVANKDSES